MPSKKCTMISYVLGMRYFDNKCNMPICDVIIILTNATIKLFCKLISMIFWLFMLITFFNLVHTSHGCPS